MRETVDTARAPSAAPGRVPLTRMKEAEREKPGAPGVVPTSLAEAVAGMSWARDLVGAAGARVHRLHAPDRATLYLKQGQGEVADEVTAEMVRLRWLGQHWPTPEVRGFVSVGDEAWLLMSAIPGLTAQQELEARPEGRVAVATSLAQHLRGLHALSVDLCPFNAQHPLRLLQARERIDAGQVDQSDFDDERAGLTPEQVFAQLADLLPMDSDLVVTHGDYSLDNILLHEGRVTGVIDVGRVGIADHYQDLAILWNGLGELGEDLQALFLRAYGIIEPDQRKLQFHLALDEPF